MEGTVHCPSVTAGWLVICPRQENGVVNMLLDLNALRSSAGQVPPAMAPYVEKTTDGFMVRGDRVAAREMLLSQNDDAVLVGDNAGELLAHLRSQSATPPLDPFGISSLLHHGLIPPPFSEFSGVLSLTMGDTIKVSWDGATCRVDRDISYPWFGSKSTSESIPSEKHLLELLTSATAAGVATTGGGGFLMLSSGKDSVAVALALSEAGLTDIPCITYRAGDDDPEPAIAADICRRLGLEHQVVELPNDPGEVAGMLTRFFEVSPLVGGDLAQIPYALATMSAGSTGGVVIDGGGNDSYMGYPVKGRWAMKTHLRIRGRHLANLAQKVTRVDSPVNYLARSRMATGISGRMMRFRESSRFMPDAVDTHEHWARISKETAHLSTFDAYAIMERLITTPSSGKKHILASRAIGHEPVLPWGDGEIADYYFNLPEEHRYDKKTGANKVLLRRMLATYLDYDADKIGKHYFKFDGARFVAENTDFIRSEIYSCDLWDRAGLGQVDNWLDQIEKRPLLYHPIITLLMVSGWRNHSRYLQHASTTNKRTNGE